MSEDHAEGGGSQPAFVPSIGTSQPSHVVATSLSVPSIVMEAPFPWPSSRPMYGPFCAATGTAASSARVVGKPNQRNVSGLISRSP